MLKRFYFMVMVMLCSIVTAWAEEVTFNPTEDVFFRTNSTNTGWNNATYPMTAEACGDGTFAGHLRVGMFVLQKYTVENLQNVTSLKLKLSGNKDQGPDALAIWSFTNDWSSSNVANNATTLAAAIETLVGIAPQSTGDATGTPLVNGTSTKTAVENDRICTYTFSAEALAAIKAAATYEGTTGVFTLLITNKTSEMNNGSSKDRKFYCSGNANADFRPTLVANVEAPAAPVVKNLTTGATFANLNDAFDALTDADTELEIYEDIKISKRLNWDKGHTLTITPKANVTFKGAPGYSSFLVKNADAVLKIGSSDYTITFDGENKAMTIDAGIVQRESNGSVELTNVTFKDFDLNSKAALCWAKNAGGTMTLNGVTVTNCSSPFGGYVNNLRVANDALILKGYFNIDAASTGTAIYQAAEYKSDTQVNGRIKVADDNFTASKVLTIDWVSNNAEKNVFIAGISVVIGVKQAFAGRFALTNQEWTLSLVNSDLKLTAPVVPTAKIGDDTYADLVAALAAVADGGEAVITLLDDQELSARVNIKDKKVTITGNKVIKRAAGYTNGLVFLTQTPSDEKESTLILDGVTLDGQNVGTTTAFVEASNNGTTTLKNVTIQNVNTTANAVIINKSNGYLVLDGVTFSNCMAAKAPVFVGTDRVTLKGENAIGTIYVEKNLKLTADNVTAASPVELITENSRTYGLLVEGGNAAHYTNSAFRLSQQQDGVYAMPKAVAQAYTHPSMLHTAVDITTAQARLETEPFKCAYQRLVEQSGRTAAGAVEYLKRMDQKNWEATYPDYNNFSTNAATDARLAYQLALRYQLKGENDAAQAAIAILNNWATVNKGFLRITRKADGTPYTNSIPDPNEYLMTIQAYEFANAAELLRDYNGWQAADFTKFQNWMRQTFADVAILFLENHHNNPNNLHYWLNWDLAALNAMMSVGILCDDKALVDYALNYVNNGAGTGNKANAVVATHQDPDSGETLAQCQESGRDQGHATLDITLLGVLCQTAQNSGANTDLWTAYKALEMAEYVGKYNLKDANGNFVYDNIPFTEYNYGEGTHSAISADARGTERPAWELFHAYAKKNDKADKYTEAWVKYLRAKNAWGEGEATSNDELGFGTLMFGAEVSVDPDPAITITVKNASREYGDANPAFEYEISGGTAEQLGGTLVLSCEATATSAVGEYAIKAAKGTATYSNLVFVDGTLTITKAPLTISAGTYTMVQGETLPTFAATYEGFKNGETAEVLATLPTLTTTATSASAPGDYAVTVSGAEAQNYDITYVAGQLIITPATGIDAILTGNSRVVIYDLNGQRVNNPQKGVYVVAGKKVVIK